GRADDRIAAVKAVARHPFMTEREVVLHGIRRVDLREPPRDLLGHPPVARLPARQTDRARDVLDVGVHRDQEPRRRDPGPEAEVGRLAADHPAEEEMQALARAARRRQREQMTVAAREASAAEHLAQVGLEEAPREALERGADGPGSIGIAGEEELLERSEERRVGKECRWGWEPYDATKETRGKERR